MSAPHQRDGTAQTADRQSSRSGHAKRPAQAPRLRAGRPRDDPTRRHTVASAPRPPPVGAWVRDGQDDRAQGARAPEAPGQDQARAAREAAGGAERRCRAGRGEQRRQSEGCLLPASARSGAGSRADRARPRASACGLPALPAPTAASRPCPAPPTHTRPPIRTLPPPYPLPPCRRCAARNAWTSCCARRRCSSTLRPPAPAPPRSARRSAAATRRATPRKWRMRVRRVYVCVCGGGWLGTRRVGGRGR